MIYFIFFTFSLFFCLIAEYFFRRYNKVVARIFAFLAVLVLSILNLIRDYSIGTDIGVYGNFYFNLATNADNMFKYCEYITMLGNFDVGYSMLNYVVSRFTHNAHIFYFVLGLITSGTIFTAIVKLQGKISMFFAWMTYLFLFYGISLNLLRQSIAMSFVFLAFVYFMDNKKTKFMACIIIAVSFHFSAIFSVFIFALIYLFKKNQNNKTKRNLFIIISCLLVFLFPRLIGYVASLGFIPIKYMQYLNSGISNEGSNLSSYMIRLPMLALMFFGNMKRKEKIDYFEISLYLLMIMEIILLPLQFANYTLGRLLLYCGVFKIFAYPYILKNYRGKLWWGFTKNSRIQIQKTIELLYVLLVIFIFVVQIMINKQNQIYPFVITNEFW